MRLPAFRLEPPYQDSFLSWYGLTIGGITRHLHLSSVRLDAAARSRGLGTCLPGQRRKAELLQHGGVILVIVEAIDLAVAEMSYPTEAHLDLPTGRRMLDERTCQDPGV